MPKPPRNLSTRLGRDTAAGPLEAAIAAEKAASLGVAGRIAEKKVEALNRFAGEPVRRTALVEAAAEAVHNYFVQRELCGLTDHRGPIETYRIPREVLVRLGARPKR